MNNTERLKFLKGKPTYHCIPRRNEHEVGCPCRTWMNEELQNALDMAKRALELDMAIKNEEVRDLQDLGDKK